jgi:hypothetical protein
VNDGNNPYGAPGSRLPAPAPLEAGPVWRAVIVALLLDIGGSILIVALTAAAYAALLFSSNAGEDEVFRALGNEDPMAVHNLVSSAGALLMSYVSGRIACRIAGLNAARAVTIIVVVLSVLGLLLGADAYPWWANGLLTLAGAGVYYMAYRDFVRKQGGRNLTH